MVDDRPRQSRRDEGAQRSQWTDGHFGEEGARSHGGAAGLTGRGGVRDSEAGGRGEGFSSHKDDGDPRCSH